MAKEIPAQARDTVNRYIQTTFAHVPELVTWHEQRVRAIPIPPHHISPEFGKLLSILVQATQAKSILEIGTMWGYSAWWMQQGINASGVEQPSIITLDKDLKHHNAAQVFFEDLTQKGMPHVIESRLVDALTELDTFSDAQFDFIFMDADKREYPDLFQKLTAKLQSGGMLVVDNIIYSSAWKEVTVADETDDGRIVRAKEFNQLIADSPEFRAVPVALNSGIMVAVKV